MGFGDGGAYAPLLEAMMRRRQEMASRQPQQMQMQPMGGTMQMQPAQFQGFGGGGGQSAMSGAMGGMPSSSSLSEMMNQMNKGWGSSDGAGVKAPMDGGMGGDKPPMEPGMWSRFSSMFSGG